MDNDIKNVKLYSLTECERILSVSHRTLLRWIKEGKLKAIKVGSYWKVKEETLRDILEGNN